VISYYNSLGYNEGTPAIVHNHDHQHTHQFCGHSHDHEKGHLEDKNTESPSPVIPTQPTELLIKNGKTTQDRCSTSSTSNPSESSGTLMSLSVPPPPHKHPPPLPCPAPSPDPPPHKHPHHPHIHHSHCGHGASLSTEVHRKRAAAYLLEFGIATHSVIIGLALGTTAGGEFVGLFIAICFHQCKIFFDYYYYYYYYYYYLLMVSSNRTKY